MNNKEEKNKETRRCKLCNTPLSVYNEDEVCFHHKQHRRWGKVGKGSGGNIWAGKSRKVSPNDPQVAVDEQYNGKMNYWSGYFSLQDKIWDQYYGYIYDKGFKP